MEKIINLKTLNKNISINIFKEENLLNNLKIINKKSVIIIDIPIQIANENVLLRNEYLGQYGKILKITINKSKEFKSNKLSYSAFILFETELDSSLTIFSIDNLEFYNYHLRASYGTNKACKYYLIKKKCSNSGCNFYHGEINETNSIYKDNNLTNFDIMENLNNQAKNFVVNNWEKIILKKNNTKLNFIGLFPNLEYIIENKNKFLNQISDKKSSTNWSNDSFELKSIN